MTCSQRMPSPLPILVGMLVMATAACTGSQVRDERPPVTQPLLTVSQCMDRHAAEMAAGVESTVYVGCP